MVNRRLHHISQFCALITVLALFCASVFGRWLEKQLAAYIFLIPYLAFVFVLLILSIAIFLFLRKRRLGEFRIQCSRLLLSAAAGLLLSYVVVHISEGLIVTPIERIHFLKYGALSIFIFFAQETGSTRRRLLTAFCLAGATGCLEECLQFFVPNRVFDLRDIVMNIFAVSVGICFIALLLFSQKSALALSRD